MSLAEDPLLAFNSSQVTSVHLLLRGIKDLEQS